MFDNYHQHTNRGASLMNVHEHRAPTDASIAILRDMEKAEDAKRIASFKVESNLLSGHIEVRRDAVRGVLSARCVYELNGKRFSDKAEVSLFSADYKMIVMKALHEAISHRIAVEIVIPAFEAYPHF